MTIKRILPILLAGSLLAFTAGCSTTPKEDGMAVEEAKQHAREMEKKAEMEAAARIKAEEALRMEKEAAHRARLAADRAAYEAEQAKRLFRKQLNK
jgi:hypothetical protein